MIYLMLAEGFEEVEAVTTVDLLRRAEIPIETCSIMGKRTVTGSHGIPVTCDLIFEECDFDRCRMIILPGGMPGTRRLDAHEGLGELLVRFEAEGRDIAAICAAPMVLGHKGVLRGRKATVYPGLESELTGAYPSEEKVVIDRGVITSKGPGTAMDFALALIRYLKDEKIAESVREGLLYR